MTLAVILPFVSTYNSTGVPSGVLPKSILSRLPWLVESSNARVSPASRGKPQITSKATAGTTDKAFFRMDDPLPRRLRIPQ